MRARPWAMSAEEIADAEDAAGDLLGEDVARLLHPSLQPDHAALVAIIERLPWTGTPIERLACDAFTIIADATKPGGPVDPADDQSDVPWSMMLNRLVAQPALGSRLSRMWFILLERFLHEDVRVSPVVIGTSAYAVAMFEDLRGREFEVSWWAMMAALHAEFDERSGLGLASVLRAARLLTRTWR